MWNNDCETFKPNSEVQVLIRTNVDGSEVNNVLSYFNDTFKTSPIIFGAGLYGHQLKVIGVKAEVDVFGNNYNIYAVGTVL